MENPFWSSKTHKSLDIEQNLDEILCNQVKQVVVGDPPRLPKGQFSAEFEDFVSQW